MEQFNIQEYLDSGVIELYVFDQLSEAEREAVEKLAAQYPEIQNEIAEVENAMGAYHTLEGLTPPDYILSNILAETATLPIVTATPEPSLKEVKALPRKRMAWLPIAAAVVGLALAGWMFMEKQTAQQNADKLQQELWALRSKEQDCAKNEQFLQKQLTILSQDGIKKIIVKGGDQPIAAVYWNQNEKAAHLNFLNLQDPGSNKQYQLWAIVAGQPVSLGVVDWAEIQKGLVSFKFDQKPEAFAISLEKQGGSPTPTDVKGAGVV
ncbi:anti-sigma factor [Haliscomenobacter hydrossis]|uniref:Regulator of SigK n=1 Tax=Haliscomenobacter hydrossis (strain ATCC 27775 / DSM 1100 / LMG 10767 / O) TaxID=760192 RepID=F4KYA0_HALH1|nr:anti-sigma factor [Haliscomenobacter hydrossis]AEE48363.1 Anti-sigma-K factor RskA [Haliscomenobacter hydrossis DSM 1100]